jgi:Mitochondrial calcium uniporter
MSTFKQPDLDYSKLQAQVNKYFDKQLDDLGLSISSIKRQSEESLRRNLIVVNHAIENHDSFGKFSVRLSAQMAVIVSAKSESHFEIGILPLLLERYQLILKRLDEFDKKKRLSLDTSQTRNLNIKTELTKIAQGEINRRLWLVIGAMVILWSLMFYLIERFGWNLLEPFTYLLGIALVIGGYAYFAIKQREFSPLTIYQHALETRIKNLFAIFGVE